MLEKWADKASRIFGKKTVEHTKQAIIEDVKQNQTSYIMDGITGLIIATGVIVAVKAIIGGVPSVPQPVYSVTNNYYITLPAEAFTAGKTVA